MTDLITAVPTAEFYPPRLTPSDHGLFAAISQGRGWTDTGAGANRFSIGGVRVRTINYGGGDSSGVWDAPWCGDPAPGQIKHGERPAFPATFPPIVIWAYDACDEMARTRAEVRENALRWLEIHGSIDVEKAVGTRLLADAGLPASSTGFLDALGQLEAEIAETGLPGFIHASPYLAPFAANANEMNRSAPGALPTTSLGTTWVFGGGYTKTLNKVMVATSQPYGWRDAPGVSEAMYEPSDGVAGSANQFVAIAEQTFAVGFEQVISAVDTTTP